MSFLIISKHPFLIHFCLNCDNRNILYYFLYLNSIAKHKSVIITKVPNVERGVLQLVVGAMACMCLLGQFANLYGLV